MVEDRVTDGARVAQLLASELSGRSDGGLERFSVVDADPDAEPSPGGTLAYRVAVDGERVAGVRIFPDGAEIRVDTGVEDGTATFDADSVVESVRGDELTTDAGPDGAVVRIACGAAVKRAVDALVAGLDA